MKPIYIRTDRNGTKIYHDYTCPRCSGYGMLDKWINTGKVCFACGGTGKRTSPKVIKEYTDEYASKLEAKRIAKQRKYEEEHADEIAQAKAEQERRHEEWKREHLQYLFSENGCDENGIGYVLKGKTYPIKDKIKVAGGRWIYGVWVCPVQIEAKGVYAVKIDISKCLDDDSEPACDVIWKASGRDDLTNYEF